MHSGGFRRYVSRVRRQERLSADSARSALADVLWFSSVLEEAERKKQLPGLGHWAMARDSDLLLPQGGDFPGCAVLCSRGLLSTMGCPRGDFSCYRLMMETVEIDEVPGCQFMEEPDGPSSPCTKADQKGERVSSN